MDKSKIVSTLNELIETSKDGEKGFRTCAEATKSADLKRFFETAAERCAEGASELQAKVRSLGGDPDRSGSVSGSLHRGWLNVKTAVTGKDDAAVLEECERGEDSAKKAYQDALKMDLPVDVRSIVERQYQGVLENHNRVRDMRNAVAH